MIKKILSVVGARPNFMKVAPLHRAFQAYPHIVSKLVHTGQHYDDNMSSVFFDQLALPKPDYHLGVHGGSISQQSAKIMVAFEQIVVAEQPDLIIVVGDVTATLAAAQVAAKMGVPLAHVEAGLRSGDGTMPEEINRVLTDAISDYLFVTEPSGLENLEKEGISAEKVFFTGNCMIDSLMYHQKNATLINSIHLYGLKVKNYVLITMHRPSNVDTREGLSSIVRMIELISRLQQVVFPLHPRTRQNLLQFKLDDRLDAIPNLKLLEAQGYLEFQNLMANATAVLTDSGGVQEETTYLQVPCLTFRSTTERPVTVEIGTNVLLTDLNPDLAYDQVVRFLNGQHKQSAIPILWDGKAAERIAAIISNLA